MPNRRQSFNRIHLGACTLLAALMPLVARAALTNLHEFTGHVSPEQDASFVEGPDGKFYGWVGAAGAERKSRICRINKDSSGYGVLHTFSGLNEKWENPNGLVYGSDNLLYGTADDQRGLGLIFSVSTNGDYHLLKQFDLAADATGQGQFQEDILSGTASRFYRVSGPFQIGN